MTKEIEYSANQLRQQLSYGTDQMSMTVSDNQLDQLLAYLEILAKWNKAYNLTAIKDQAEMVIRHLLDSLSIAAYIQGTNICDVGSGAGLPGIPLAILLPEKHFTLLDSNGKKTRFMVQAINTLHLDNVSIVQKRAESWKPGNKFDVITTRAFSDLSYMVSMTRHLLKDSGFWMAMKGTYPQDEITKLTNTIPDITVDACKTLSVPGCEQERRLMILSMDKSA